MSCSSLTTSSPYQTPSPRTSMSFEERQAQIAYSDASAKILYAEPQPLYQSPGYISDDQWASADCAPYVPTYKVPALADSRPRVMSEWSDVGPFSLPPYQQPPAYIQSQQFYPELYTEPVPLSGEDVYPEVVKSEPAVVVPTQAPYYSRPPSVASSMSSPMPHHVVHVVFTDDAASKETQYLRRRCHNCQQVEPPSWRRSHLVPGKIVCNRCGLYERTHLRPRPHRFDEVRTGNKGRKPTKQGSRTGSPQPAVTQFTVKQELVPDVDLNSRRGSVESSSTSSHGEWDDTYLAAGNGSRLSPPQQHSPGHEGGVQRGPTHFNDSALAARFRTGRKSATAPYDAFSAVRMGPPTPPLVPAEGIQSDPALPLRRHTLGSDVAAWSSLPSDFSTNVLQNAQQSVVSNIAY